MKTMAVLATSKLVAVLGLFACLLNQGIYAQNQLRTYPAKLHERVIAKLNERRGVSSADKFGSWGSWSAWSPCSMSCGTGVTTQSRECRVPKVRNRVKNIDVRGENRCVGRYKRFQLCNTQICPGGPVDFRRQQCAAFNRTPFNGRFYSWLPFIESPDSCTLNCRAVGLSFYATLNQSVVDGTPCGAFQPYLNTQNRICVAGNCLLLGCDGLLGSGRTLDSCGICGGNNSTCRLISGVYLRPNLPFGYNLIATLPSGAQNLSIYHTRPSSNYLALREMGGNYILNGPSGMNSSGSFESSGTIFTYSRPHVNGGDHLYARGPTTHSLDVMLFYQMPDPGIKYEYRLVSKPSNNHVSRDSHQVSRDSHQVSRDSHQVSRDESTSFDSVVPGGSSYNRHSTSGLVNDAITINAIPRNRNFDHKKNSAERKYKLKKENELKYKAKKNKEEERKKEKKRKKRYHWIVNGFTPCSQTCGGGTQTTRNICVKKRKKEIEAPPYFCAGLPEPPIEVVRCNLRPCPATWEANSWEPCSVTCGTGIQTRTLSCRQRVSSDLTIDVPELECKNSPKQITAQVCQLRDCNSDPEWSVQLWSACSSQCGLGTRKRLVQCTTIDSIVEDHKCKDLKPIEEEMCDMGSCASDTWFFSPWEPSCRGPCGEGVQRRRIYCSGDPLDGKSFSSCSAKAKPSDTRSCSNEKLCHGSWFAGPWSECDVHCGTGHQWRPVLCVTWSRGRYRVAKSESYCKGSGDKPADSKPCASDCKAEWFTSDWSECSALCDNGVQRREVKCFDHHQKPSLDCSSAVKPDSRQTCNTQPCRKEHLNDSASPKEDVDYTQQFPNDSSVPSYIEDQSASNDNREDIQQFSKAPSCINRMKNCHLVYKARLCKLRYYNKLCCHTCSTF